MPEANVTGVFPVHILAQLLTENGLDVTAGLEPTIDVPLGAAVAELTVTAQHAHGAHHHSITDRNASGVTEQDRGTDRVRLGMLVGPYAGVPRYATNGLHGDRTILHRREALGDGDLVAVVAGGVCVHADQTRIDNCILRVDDEQVLLGRTRGVDIGGREGEGEVREEPEEVDRGQSGGGCGTTTLDREGSGAGRDGFTEERLGIKPRARPGVTVWIDRVELLDHVTIELHVAALEEGILVVLFARTGFAEDLLVIGVLLQAEKARRSPDNAVLVDRAAADGAHFARTATQRLQGLAHREDVVVAEAIGAGDAGLGSDAARVEQVFAAALEDEGHAGAGGLFTAHPLAELFNKARRELVDHTHLLVHALGATGRIAQVVRDHLVGVDHGLLEVGLVVEKVVTALTAAVEAGERGNTEGQALADRRVIDDMDRGIGGRALEFAPEIFGLLEDIDGLLPDNADRVR